MVYDATTFEVLHPIPDEYKEMCEETLKKETGGCKVIHMIANYIRKMVSGECEK